MSIREVHSPDKQVSAVSIFKGGEGTVISLQILKGQTLKEHLTKTPALLVCVEGRAVFENEKGEIIPLLPGSKVDIEAMVKHWVVASEDSLFLLVK